MVDGLEAARHLLAELLLTSIEHQGQEPALDLVQANGEQESISYGRQISCSDVRAELGDDELDEVLVAETGGPRDPEVVGDVGVDLDDDVAVELQRLQVLPLAQVPDHERPAARSVRHPGGAGRVQRRLLEDDQRLRLA